MLTIKKENIEYDMEFNNIKIINTSNPTKFYRDQIVDAEIFIDAHKVKSDEIVYINELTRLNEFIGLSKKSFLLQLILDKIGDAQLIDREFVQNIIEYVNAELGLPILDACDGDIQKLINYVMEITDDYYLDERTFNLIVEKQFTEKKLFIIDNVSWFKLSNVYKYLNEHSFIILCNDFRNYINSMRELEIIAIWNNSQLSDLLDYEKVIAYLEKNVSEPVNNERFSEFLNKKDSLWSIRLYSLIMAL